MTITLASPTLASPAAALAPIGHDLPFHFCSVCRSPIRPVDLTWVDYLPRHCDCDPSRPVVHLVTAREAEA